MSGWSLLFVPHLMHANPSTKAQALDPRFVEFIRLYNAHLFYESHEVLEDLWLDDRGPDRLFYQGLIMFSTSFLHLEKGNLSAFAKLLVSARAKLISYEEHHLGLDLRVVRGSINDWGERLGRHSPITPVQFEPGLIPRLVLG